MKKKPQKLLSALKLQLNIFYHRKLIKIIYAISYPKQIWQLKGKNTMSKRFFLSSVICISWCYYYLVFFLIRGYIRFFLFIVCQRRGDKLVAVDHWVSERSNGYVVFILSIFWGTRGFCRDTVRLWRVQRALPLLHINRFTVTPNAFSSPVPMSVSRILTAPLW